MDWIGVRKVLWISLLIGAAVGLWSLLGQAGPGPRAQARREYEPRPPMTKGELLGYLGTYGGAPEDWERLAEMHLLDGENDLAFSAFGRAEQEYLHLATSPPASAEDEQASRLAGWWYRVGLLREERLGRPESARDAYREAMEIMQAFCALRPERVPLYNLACYASRAGEHDLAIASFERALAAGWENHRRASEDDDLAPLHDDPRFMELLLRIDPTRAGG